jgi:Copper amine oxidase N-terminal domain/Intracellular proteinase inhibitor
MPAVAAAAVAVFINGCQVLLPTPAFQRGDTVLVPVKGVFDRLGARITWDPASKVASVSASGAALDLALGSTTAQLNGSPLDLQVAPELSEGSLMVPLRLVAQALGADIAWDQQRRRVYLHTEAAGPPVHVTVAELIDRPEAWSGRLVLLEGEYMGWQPSPFSPCTRNGVPVSRRDWVLRDTTGEIYCRGDISVGAPFPLTPYSNVGRRLVVAAVGRVARSGFVFLEPREIAEQPPPPGLVCTVTTSRRAYMEGEPVRIRLKVVNPFAAPVRLTCKAGPAYDLVLRDREGREAWRLSQDSPPPSAAETAALAAGEALQFDEVLDPSRAGGYRLPPGRYTVEGQWGGVLCSYPHLIGIVPRQG